MSENIDDALGISNSATPMPGNNQEPAAETKYPALRFVSGVLKFFGWLAAIAGVVCVLVGLVELSESSTAGGLSRDAVESISILTSGATLLLAGLITAAIGEAARVLMDIEANTRK